MKRFTKHLHYQVFSVKVAVLVKSSSSMYHSEHSRDSDTSASSDIISVTEVQVNDDGGRQRTCSSFSIDSILRNDEKTLKKSDKNFKTRNEDEEFLDSVKPSDFLAPQTLAVPFLYSNWLEMQKMAPAVVFGLQQGKFSKNRRVFLKRPTSTQIFHQRPQTEEGF